MFWRVHIHVGLSNNGLEYILLAIISFYSECAKLYLFIDLNLFIIVSLVS